jgi:ubiquinone/menaquinone biosynthesis C-methylase UbiE
MIFSKTMNENDYPEFVAEGQVLITVRETIQMWLAAQHKHRLWEYALAQKVLKEVFGDKNGLRVCDVGCAGSFLAPILYWLGNHVVMYDIWSMGNYHDFTMEQMRKVAQHRREGSYEFKERGLGGMQQDDRDFDAAFCVSTIEHIAKYQEAFVDLLDMVKPGGLVFLTSDFAEDEEDHYQYSYLRAGKMFTKKTYEELIEIGKNKGFHLLGGKHDLTWGEENRLVNDYGFGALALVRES